MAKFIVVGGGASGLVAGIMASRSGASVTILEKNKSCGKKLLVTGNGKCNYYNSKQDVRYYHSSNEDVLSNIITKNNLDKVLEFFDSIGVVPRVKGCYYYPYSNTAVSVLNALMDEVRVLGINVVNEVNVLNVYKNNDNFVIESDKGNYYSDKVIMAMGSYAYYKNTNVNSYDIASKVGHSIIKPRPSLVQLVVEDKITKNWSGVRVSANIKLYRDNKFVREEDGEVLFTSYGISGICAMQVSRDVNIGIDNGSVMEVVINLIPSIARDVDGCIEFIDNYNSRVKDRTIIQIMDSILNYKLGNAICDRVGIKYDSKWNDLSDKEKIRLVSSIVSFRIGVVGTMSNEHAQVCSGGVSIDEVDYRTMESLKVKGLYITGELLDVDGDCGGYNLTFAWISGILAGVSSALGDNYD